MAVFKQIGHRSGGAGREGLQRFAQARVFADQPGRPRFVVQSIHLLTGVAERGVAHVVQQGCGVEQPTVLFELRLQTAQLSQGAAG